MEEKNISMQQNQLIRASRIFPVARKLLKQAGAVFEKDGEHMLIAVSTRAYRVRHLSLSERRSLNAFDDTNPINEVAIATPIEGQRLQESEDEAIYVRSDGWVYNPKHDKRTWGVADLTAGRLVPQSGLWCLVLYFDDPSRITWLPERYESMDHAIQNARSLQMEGDSGKIAITNLFTRVIEGVEG